MSHRIAQDLTPDGMLAPLSGVRRMLLVSLEEAIGSSGIDGIPCIAELPGMDDIDDAVFAALGKAEELIASGGPDPHGLTAQHIAALNLYTQDVLYAALNKALRAADREQIKPYFSFLRCVSSRPHLLKPPHPSPRSRTHLGSLTRFTGCSSTHFRCSQRTTRTVPKRRFSAASTRTCRRCTSMVQR